MNRFFEYLSAHPYLVGVTAFAALVAIVLEVRHRSRGSAAVGPTEAVLLANQGALMLDIRGDEQFASGHVIDARHIRGDALAGSLDSIKKFKEKPVVVCCENGMTSATAVRVLRANGFTKAVNLRGGLAAWRQENLPLVTESARNGNRGKQDKGAKA